MRIEETLDEKLNKIINREIPKEVINLYCAILLQEYTNIDDKIKIISTLDNYNK